MFVSFTNCIKFLNKFLLIYLNLGSRDYSFYIHIGGCLEGVFNFTFTTLAEGDIKPEFLIQSKKT